MFGWLRRKEKQPPVFDGKRALLIRASSGDEGTFGVIKFGDNELFTGELPDYNNAPNISCIPEGVYTCRFTYSPAFKRNMYLVCDVNNRSGIRIHSANYMGDRAKGLKSHLYGCIALGRKIGTLHGQKALLVSKPAISDFETFMGGDDFELEIVNNV